MTGYLSLRVSKKVTVQGRDVEISNSGLIGLCPLFAEKTQALEFTDGDENGVLEVEYTPVNHEIPRS